MSLIDGDRAFDEEGAGTTVYVNRDLLFPLVRLSDRDGVLCREASRLYLMY